MILEPARHSDQRDPKDADRVDVRSDDLAGRLALAVGRANRRMRSSTGGLSHGLLSALAIIVQRGPLRPRELALIENVAAPTITRFISQLESRGLVARERDSADQRSFFVSGTPAGVELLVKARSDRALATAAMLEELDEPALAAIRAALPALEQIAQIPADFGR